MGYFNKIDGQAESVLIILPNTFIVIKSKSKHITSSHLWVFHFNKIDGQVESVLIIPQNTFFVNKSKSNHIISSLLYRLPMHLLNVVFDPDTAIKSNNDENMADYT